MLTLKAILGVLGTVALGLAGYLISDNQKPLAFKFLIFSFIIYFVDAVLIFVDHFNKTPFASQSLFEQSARDTPPPKDLDKSPATNQPDNPKLRQAVIRLKVLNEHLPKDDLSGTYVSDYHALLDVAGAELQQDLTAFRIPESELKRHVEDLNWQGANSGWQVKESKELFCPPQVFRIALRGALNFIETCPPPQTESQIKASDKPKELEAKAKSQSSEKSKCISRFNVLWDENRDPFCPICEKRIIPLQIPKVGSRLMGDLKCMSCQEAFLLTDDEGEHVTFAGAKKLLRQEETETNIKSPQPSTDYDPDDMAIKILVEIERGVVHESELARVSKLEPSQVGNSLRLLERHDYVRLVRPEGRGPYYQITQKGVDRLDRPANRQPQTTALSAHPKNYAPDETAVEVLKQIHKGNGYEVEIAVALQLNPTHVAIRLAQLSEHDYIKLDPRDTRAGRYILAPKGDEYLDRPHYKAPHPSGDLLDGAKIAILQLLADPNFIPTESCLAHDLQMHVVRVQVHMSELTQHDYVTGNSFNEYHERKYLLTDKAKKFLIERKLIP